MPLTHWKVELSDGTHVVEFDHGTTSGKRIIIVDGNELTHKNAMFALTGRETFKIGKHKAAVDIAAEGFSYIYSLLVDGKPLCKFYQQRENVARAWIFERYKVVIEMDTLDVYVNGNKVVTTEEFVPAGTQRNFQCGRHECIILITQSAESSKKKGTIGATKRKLMCELYVDDDLVSPAPMSGTVSDPKKMF